MDILSGLLLLLILALITLSKHLKTIVLIMFNLATIITFLTSRSIGLHEGDNRRSLTWLLRDEMMHFIFGLMILILIITSKFRNKWIQFYF